jgi:hypothetical protein
MTDGFCSKAPGIFAGPLPFHDPIMEKRFREHFVNSALDRARPILCYFWLPVAGTLRLLWLLYYLTFPYNIATLELVVMAGRIFLLVFLGVVFSITNLTDYTKRRIGHSLIWILRAFALLILTQQYATKSSDPDIITVLAGYVCVSGIGFASFAEYLGISVILVCIRPLLLYLHPSSPSESALEALFQNTLILALGVCTTFAVHSDCRRDWLRSAASSSPAAAGSAGRNPIGQRERRGVSGKNALASSQRRQKRAAAAAAAATAAAAGGWDLLVDGYFSDSDRAEEGIMAVQVRQRR